MILPFTIQINGKPNFFIEKIWSSFPKDVIDSEHTIYLGHYIERFACEWDRDMSLFFFNEKGKRHTIREDKTDRWQAGKDIHFMINNRSPDAFQFAPVMQCISVQKIEIWYQPELFTFDPPRPWVFVDGVSVTKEKIDQLAFNDGFNSYEEFVAYFPKDFKGKIIHWTDLKY